MQPTIGSHQTPPFWEMQGIPFQQFCRDILAKDASVETCDQHGINGKTDFGVDLRATLKNQTGLLLAQCKAYQQFPAAKIKSASNAFFKHWNSRWKNRQVKRFLLMISCDINDTSQQDEIDKQKARFAAEGIAFECWSASTLVTVLQPHREIVERYLGPSAQYWAVFICGQSIAQGQRTSESMPIDPTIADQITRLSSTLAHDTKAMLEQAVILWKEGDTDGSNKTIRELATDDIRWSALDASVKAEILSFRGRVALEQHDIADANAQAIESEKLGDFPSTSYLRSLIALHDRDQTNFEIHIARCLPEDAVRVRASKHLQNGSAAEALQCLSQFETGGQASLSADFLRLRALAFLLTKQVTQALATIDEALALQPKWRYSKFVSGIIRYYAALSSIEIPQTLPPWPSPVDWALVKNNDEARLRLSEAVKTFSNILENPCLCIEEVQQIRGWMIAALSSNTATQETAELECAKSLQKDCLDEAAIAWSVARKYATNLDKSKEELEIKCEQRTINVNQTLSLVLLYLRDNRFADADTLLDTQKHLFEKVSQQTLWTIWKSQTLLLNKKYEEAVTLVGGADHFPIELLPLIHDDALVRDLLQRNSSDKPEGRSLFNICLAKAMQKDWRGIAILSESLVKEVQTQEAVRLAAESLHSVGEYSQCIGILETNLFAFNAGQLPEDLQTLQADCLHKLGRVNAALEKARLAADAHENTQTLLYYARMLFNTGNLKALVLIVKRLAKRRDLTGVQAIRLAESIYRDDQITAAKLWRHAVRASLKGDDVFLAVTLGYQLGLEQEPEYTAIQRQLKRLAQEGSSSAKLVSLEEIRTTIQQRHAASEARWNAYRNGQGFAHTLCDIPRILQISSKMGAQRLPLINSHIVFAVHEDRKALLNIQVAHAPAIPWKLNIDLTALLLAETFNFLNAVIEQFQPVGISSEAIASLLFYRQMYSELPTDRLKILEKMTTALDSSRIQVFNQSTIDLTGLSISDINEALLLQTIDLARQNHGYVLEEGPSEGTEKPLASASVMTDCRAVMTHIQGKLHLSTTEYDSIVAQLPQVHSTMDSTLVLGSKLYTSTALLECFAKANALDYVLNHFEVYVPQSQAGIIRSEIATNDQLHELSLWLTTLIEKLGSWIDEGKVQCLPSTDGENQDETPPIQALKSLLSFDGKPPSAIWVDDRFINVFMQQEKGVPIVSTWEVLSALDKSGEKMTSYYHTLLELRAANIRYLPVLQNEILYHLNQASIAENGILIETAELEILQEYIAACVAEPSLMRKHQVSDLPMTFLGVLKQSLFLAWCELWSSRETFETKVARANWLIDDLFMDPLSLSLLCNDHSSESSIAKAICEFLLAALFVIPKAGAEECNRYLVWLDERLLSTLLRDYPNLSVEVLTQLKQYLAVSMQESEINPELTILFQWWSKQFPAPLRRVLQKDPAFMSKFGLRNATFGSMRGLTYELDQLEQKAKESLSSNEAIEIKALEDDVTLTTQRMNDGRVELKFKGVKGVEYALQSDEIQFLFNVPHSRRQAIARNRHWIDVGQDQFEAISSGLAYLEPASSRIDQLHYWQDHNLLRYYAELEERLNQKQKVLLSDLLPPSIESLLNHYRLTTTNDGTLVQHIEQLLSSEPDLAACLIAGLPISMPDELLHQIDTLSLNSHRQLVRTLSNFKSPVAIFQLLRVLTATRKTYGPYKRLKRKVLNSILSEAHLAHADAFIVVLRWLTNRFGRWQEARKISWKLRLALVWLHSSNIFDLLVRSLPLTVLSETFSKARYSLGSSFLDTHDPMRSDVASPTGTSPEQLCLSGITYGLSDSEVSSLSDQLIDFALLKNGEEFWPKAEFLMHRGTSDAISSFLATDEDRLSKLIPPFTALASSAFEEKARLCLDQIREGTDSQFWWLLLHATAKASPNPEVIERTKSLVDEKGLVALCRDSSSPMIPMLTVSRLLGSDEKIRDSIFDQVVEMAKNQPNLQKDSPDSQQTETQRRLQIGFVEAGLILCRNNEQLDTEKFTDFMLRILDASPSFNLALATAIEAVWMEMPYKDAARFWDLRKRLQAQRRYLKHCAVISPDGST